MDTEEKAGFALATVLMAVIVMVVGLGLYAVSNDIDDSFGTKTGTSVDYPGPFPSALSRARVG